MFSGVIIRGNMDARGRTTLGDARNKYMARATTLMIRPYLYYAIHFCLGRCLFMSALCAYLQVQGV